MTQAANATVAVTEKEAVQMFLTGNPVVLVEYRSSIPEVVEYRNKTTGAPEQFKKVTHNVEMGNLSVQVIERVTGELNPANYKPQFVKGQKCLMLIEGFQREKGAYKASGSLQVLKG
jgi:hypothetical protein